MTISCSPPNSRAAAGCRRRSSTSSRRPRARRTSPGPGATSTHRSSRSNAAISTRRSRSQSPRPRRKRRDPLHDRRVRTDRHHRHRLHRPDQRHDHHDFARGRVPAGTRRKRSRHANVPLSRRRAASERYGPAEQLGPRRRDYAMDPDVANDPLYAGTIRDDLKSLPALSLVMDRNDWFGTGGQGIYVAGKGLRAGRFRRTDPRGRQPGVPDQCGGADRAGERHQSLEVRQAVAGTGIRGIRTDPRRCRTRCLLTRP